MTSQDAGQVEPGKTTLGRDLGVAPGSSEEPQNPAYYAKSWALVIGIDDYGGNHPGLANARNDAEAIAALLKDWFSFEHVDTLYDSEAAHDAILTRLRDEFPQKVGKDDRVVIFFAGHGTTRQSEAGGYKRGYLIPQDAEPGKFSDYIDMTEVSDACNWIKAKHILIILDCCFSGVAAVASRATPPAAPSVLSDIYVQRITARQARQVLTAGASDEVVADSGTRPGHSAFTGALLAGLEGLADLNGDGIITATDLAGYVKPEVTRATASPSRQGQTPYYNYLAGSDLGDFVFVRPDRPVQLETVGGGEPRLFEGGKRPVALWAGVAAAALLLIVVIWYLAGAGNRETERKYAELIGTATASAQQVALAQQATLESVADDPAPTRTAVALGQTAQFVQQETSVAATIEAFRTGEAQGRQPATTPSTLPTVPPPTDTPSPPTATPTVTPDGALTAQADATATMQAARNAAARQTEASRVGLTATATHLLVNGPMQVAGATSLEGLTNRMIQLFRSATGYKPELRPDYTGTSGGFERFCAANSEIDVVLATGTNAEQPYLERCRAAGRDLVGFQVAVRPVDVARDRPNPEPLTLYTTARVLRAKPQVAAFIRYYLENSTQVIAGLAPNEYQPVAEATRSDALQRLGTLTGP